MRLFRNKVITLFFGRGIVHEGWEFHLALIPRRDLTPEGFVTYCGLAIDVFMLRDLVRGRWVWPRFYIRSDARWIGETVAARAGA